MLLVIVGMLKKKLGINAIERYWCGSLLKRAVPYYFKVPSALIISEGCKKIGERAFEYCDRLEKVVIPKSVERIGDCAFWGCKNATITLKKHKSEFEYLNSTAFEDCKDVKEKIRY